MGQVSYGTITVSDLTDITDVYLIYAVALSSADEDLIKTDHYDFDNLGERGWDDEDADKYPTWVSGYQIWIRKVTEKEGIDTPEYGTPYLDTAVNQINTQINHIDTLLGGHFLWHGTNLTASTSAGARIVEQVKDGTIDVSGNPTKWKHNVNLGANGIQLRYNEAVMAQLMASQNSNEAKLRFYKSPTITSTANGDTTTQGDLAMELTGSGLSFYGSSTSIADATLTSDGLKLSKGGIEAGNAGESGFIYFSTEDYNGNKVININGNNNYWRQIIGSKFGVKKDGTLYASNVVLSGDFRAANGKIGGFIIDKISMHSLGKNAYNDNNNGIYIRSTQEERNTTLSQDNFVDWIGSTGEGMTTGRFYYVLDYEPFTNEQHGSLNLDNFTIVFPSSIQEKIDAGLVDFSCAYVTSVNPGQTIIQPISYTNDTSIIKYLIEIHMWGSFSIVPQTAINGSTINYITTSVIDSQFAIGTNNGNHLIYNGSSLDIKIDNNFSVTTNGKLTAVNADLKALTIYDADGNKRAAATNSGFIVYDGTSANTNTELARFGTSTIIGKTGNAHIEITGSGISALGGSNAYDTKYFEVGNTDMVSRNITENFPGETEATTYKYYYLAYVPISRPTVKINNSSDGVVFAWNGPGDPVVISEVDVGDEVSITYETYGANGYFTFGTRQYGSSIGNNSFTIGSSNVANGEGSIALGSGLISSGRYSYAEGINTKATADYSHAEGYISQAIGEGSHAEGYDTIASGYYSHAEGYSTVAGEDASHAEGYNTEARRSSHAEGIDTYAIGIASHASGQGTITQSAAQTVVGAYNILDTGGLSPYIARGNYAFIIGNGSSSERSNALTVDWKGGIDIAGISSSSSWYNQRDYAQIKRSGTPNSDTLNPFISIKTHDGDWDISTYTNNRLFFSYIIDSNYSQGTNTRTGYVSFDTSGNILANNLRFGPIAYGDYNTNYHWVAYSNNTYEMWYSATASRAVTTSTSNGWYRSDQYTLTPPSSISGTLLDGTSKTFTFNSIQYIDLKAIANLAYIYTNITSATIGSVSYYITHLGTVPARDMTITLYVRGTWT